MTNVQWQTHTKRDTHCETKFSNECFKYAAGCPGVQSASGKAQVFIWAASVNQMDRYIVMVVVKVEWISLCPMVAMT